MTSRWVFFTLLVCTLAADARAGDGALALTPLLSPVLAEQRPELLMVARRAEGAR